MAATHTITINVDTVIYDIEAIVQKAFDVKDGGQSTISSYAIRPDETPLDRNLILRLIDRREADLRMILMPYEEDDDSVSENNELNATSNGTFIFALTMPDTWKNSLIKPLTAYMHRYLVWGVLFDYYSTVAPELAASYDTLQTERDVITALSKRITAVKAPLQPF